MDLMFLYATFNIISSVIKAITNIFIDKTGLLDRYQLSL